MNAGNRNQRITIEKKTNITNEMGEEIVTWVPFATLSAELLIGFGREFFGAKKLNTELSGIIKILYISGVKLREMRVKYGERIFEIIAVIEPGERRAELELHVKEVVI